MRRASFSRLALKEVLLPEPSQPLIEGEDYYMDGPYLVFTEAYHLKRGACCNSGCRHCPWREERDGDTSGAKAP
ncbi:DUF5522 domain-containing protein [Silvibacterium acidisoli]|uniref:DUF5522 domain-containing protein n=1 Tax=Acidobacteriaceae bacterium ZG23-2 TaxID=2883246 RepID=UPI00406BFD52